ncbi:MAG: 1-(5-phosphoribosyl)-5-[(5-phosphoribosylamino)methylideneamino] imidazole-4-carboxamide isomerase [Proteobacteria bacterium]|nr:1-(5-phosphoribosyl)-5-[(5-phosphoribosylamino)methylideneamino] imidazole-4-carboxamide isomerase [Pseudomonadota bacterium]MBU4258253.1 1-(5-phosphoribosyl)-5-[(5-phosphoribosylamino)methylideneamino] imidazole-4-carboxamide isomerase [Pseudomonadota bacterium]MBU4288226.1 1-(5-phosphoribosyl)-5-[(5-phosphoribosylamino)methylideneamino] imidazole-4-carboxamide isomerase [Pseudomonadota bacterium]MCG2758977.1 1-(5-phosphoribosyl)-5-[(5-phosphoribosylamino)methylideneamino] imidazole-4-carbox
MLIIPAVNIKGGRCVQLLQGREEPETVFSHDPLVMALKWEAEGAELLHVIDLDGEFRKTPQNIEAIQKIVDRLKIPVQLGGGIRDIDTIKMYLDMGVSRIILGTEAIRTPDLVYEALRLFPVARKMVIEADPEPDLVYEALRLFPGHIIVRIDACDGFVAMEGCTETTKVRSIDFARRFEGCGLTAIIYADIHRDGIKTGPNIREIKRLAESVSIPIIASGGVSSIDDIKQLLTLKSSDIIGVIIGRALYSDALNLRESLKLVNAHPEIL